MRIAIIAAGIGSCLAAAPAYAQYDVRGSGPGYDYGYGQAYATPVADAFPVDRELAERCGFRAGSMRPHVMPAYYDGYAYRRRDDGLGGALIGGAVGGLVGNRIAGRGDRTEGTIAGAVVGAVAGAAIDRAEDDRYADPRPAYGYAESGVDYSDECVAILPPGYRLVAVPGEPECRDEVVTREEWVPETVTIPAETPRRAPPVRDKRTKLRRVN
jgi:hypothetical protein